MHTCQNIWLLLQWHCEGAMHWSTHHIPIPICTMLCCTSDEVCPGPPQRLPLADAITIFFFNPSITAIAAWLVLGEHLSPLGAAGCATSIAGVAVLTRPPLLFGGEPFTPERLVGVAFGCASAAFATVCFIAVRVLGTSESTLTLAMWFHASASASSGGLLLAGVQAAVPPGAHDCALLAAVGVTACAGQLLLQRGFQTMQASRASAINFSQVGAAAAAATGAASAAAGAVFCCCCCCCGCCRCRLPPPPPPPLLLRQVLLYTCLQQHLPALACLWRSRLALAAAQLLVDA
jgi:drug/metabolite transporter (DMT)-like permease